MTEKYDELNTWNWNTICSNVGCFEHVFSGGKTIDRPG
jgi:TPP-dependent 2-oxoacid decarboxylase